MMTHSFRWPLLAVVLVGGLAVGRYVGLPTVQGQAAAADPPAIPAK